MRGTGVDIVTRRGKRIDRTRGQTRLIGTVHAWTYTWFIGGEFQFFVENKRAPIGVPQPVFRMDCHAGRRDMNRFSLYCPAQEGRIGRAVERENRVRAERGGDGVQDTLRPGVKRGGSTRLARLRIRSPHRRTCISDDKDRLSRRVIRGGGMKPATRHKPLNGECLRDILICRHAFV